MNNRTKMGGIFFALTFLVLAPFMMGGLSGLSVNSNVWDIPAANPLPASRVFGPIGLDGSQSHSLFYEFTGSVTITVELGIQKSDGSWLYAVPAGVGPFSGTGPSIEPLFLPVGKAIRFTVAGAGASGTLAFNES